MTDLRRYADSVDALLLERYGLNLGDAGTGIADLEKGLDEGWSPEELVSWIGFEHCLETDEDF